MTLPPLIIALHDKVTRHCGIYEWPLTPYTLSLSSYLTCVSPNDKLGVTEHYPPVWVYRCLVVSFFMLCRFLYIYILFERLLYMSTTYFMCTKKIGLKKLQIWEMKVIWFPVILWGLKINGYILSTYLTGDKTVVLLALYMTAVSVNLP